MKETRIISYPNKKNFKKAMVASALGLSLAIGTTSVPVLNNVSIVEAAKKDKKKPKITLKGQKTLTVEEGEKVTIPKTTYSDNKTKKKKLKVGVTVKKGSKKYSSIAKKIKKATLKSKPVAVEFPEDGTYKITTTVTDLAKNKATAVRTVVVNEKDVVIDDQQIDVKQDPATTEEVKRTVTTETPVTETPKTEEPKKEETPVASTVDLSKYGPVKQVEINGITYNVIFKYDMTEEQQKFIASIKYNSTSSTFTCDGARVTDVASDDTEYYHDQNNYLAYYGNMKIIDEYGVDCSKNIFILQFYGYDQYYYVNSKGEVIYFNNVTFKSYDYAMEDFDESYWQYVNPEKKLMLYYYYKNDNYDLSAIDNKQIYILKTSKKELI